ncbi:phosphoenolpyruvate carboxylase [Halomarina halobia]|uniref:Phosphoenolpyruvate carboxylase n=1 Tax=Halomarina halobia TaxID=3033386 RepID=A0ABD6ADI7_9EURY
MPGWYSLASGLDTYLDSCDDVETCREMYDEWTFFRKTVDNAALALARTDMDVAAEYAGLADDDLRESFFYRLRREHDRGAELVRDIPAATPYSTVDSIRGPSAAQPLRRPHLLQVRLLDDDERSVHEE